MQDSTHDAHGKACGLSKPLDHMGLDLPHALRKALNHPGQGPGRGPTTGTALSSAPYYPSLPVQVKFHWIVLYPWLLWTGAVWPGFGRLFPSVGCIFILSFPLQWTCVICAKKKEKNCCFSASHWPQGLLFAQNPKSKTCVVLEVISDGFLSGLSGSTIARHVRRWLQCYEWLLHSADWLNILEVMPVLHVNIN
jgi:hypothetical protein